MVSPKVPKQVVIIGSGVIGLTCAYELSSKYPPNELEITIIARDMPDDGLDSTGWASPWAGANWYPFLNRDPENRWERVSFERFKKDVPSDIVMDLPSKLYSSDPERGKSIWFQDVVGNFKPIAEPYPPSIGSTPPTASAFEFVTISINVPRYLHWLQAELKGRGVKFVKEWVSSVADLEYVPTEGGGSDGNKVKTDVIVNASGLGAKSIIGIADPLVHPIRGQTVLVRAPKVNWCLMGLSFYVNPETSESTYLIPRPNGDVVLGGTFQVGNWDVSPDPAIARGILERCLTYCPELATQPPATPNATTTPDISTIKVLRHNVGLRPARTGGARVEKEIITLPSTSSSSKTWSSPELATVPSALKAAQSTPDVENRDAREGKTFRVVHAYGVGPAGYQESWGVAEDVCGGTSASSGGIMNMPIEIFAEICSYLDPLDLRYLALTNKMFRDALMNKEAKHIWKKALASDVDLPNCPTDLNEPQFVRLMYSSDDSEKRFYVDEVKDVAEKYKALLRGSNAEERVAEYDEQLKNQSGYRALTGAALLKCTLTPQTWDHSVKAKLEDAGWKQIDFPFECQEFLDFVFGDQQITPTIWQNMEPELVPLIQGKRDKRLEQERQHRKWRRERDFSQLYSQTAYGTLRVWYTCWRLCSFAPDEKSILALPRVRDMVEADTDGISGDQWSEVEDEVRTSVRQHWRTILRRVLTVVETGAALPIAEDNIKPHEDKNEEQLLGEIEDMMGKLSRVTASFVCKSDTCHELHWFPDVFIHGFCMNPAADLSNLLRYCDSLDAERRRLVKRLLLDLGLDGENATAADVKDLKNLICTRCDPTVGTYSSFAQIAKHYMRAPKPFVLVDRANRAHRVVSDHDWLSNDASLVRQDSGTESASTTSLHTACQTQVIPSSEA
ncbi:hypothetical protein FRC05_001085 [Tulasnella sp. 425]|nr:hypothetical protein FRC05_001085 [Tulasnella sp. 425]